MMAAKQNANDVDGSKVLKSWMQLDRAELKATTLKLAIHFDRNIELCEN